MRQYLQNCRSKVGVRIENPRQQAVFTNCFKQIWWVLPGVFSRSNSISVYTNYDGWINYSIPNVTHQVRSPQTRMRKLTLIIFLMVCIVGTSMPAQAQVRAQVKGTDDDGKSPYKIETLKKLSLIHI